MQDQQRYVFIHGKSGMSKREKLILLVLGLFFLAVLFWMTYWELLKPEDLKKVLGSTNIWQRILPMLLPFAVLVFGQGGMQWAYRSAKLVVDSKGMFLEWSADSVFARLKFLQKKIVWADLQNATHLPSFNVLQLRSKTNSSSWVIRLKDWTISNVEFSHDAVKFAEMDLLNVLRQQGIFETASKDVRLLALEFDLMKHPLTRKILMGVGALLVYCFADTLIQHEGWAFFNKDYLMPHLVIASLATVVLFWVVLKAGKDGSLPMNISLTMVVIAGFSFLATSYVAGIRLNQLAGGPLVSAEYHRDDSCEKLIPVEKNLPIVEYTSKTRDYWCSIKAEDVIRVKVRQGLFGKFQFNLTEQTQTIHEFMQKH